MVVRWGDAPPTPEDVVAIAEGERVELSPEAVEAMAASRAVVERAIASGEPVYGLNRRLGAGRDDAVDPAEFAEFQRRTIANHRGGIGDPLPVAEARAVMAARLAGFTRGGAGVRPELAEAYTALLNAHITPVIPSRGSVGAADLTVLAEVAAVVTGEGVVLASTEEGAGGFAGARGATGATGATGTSGATVAQRPAAEALAAAGLSPLALAPHEALAALSSNAYSIGVGALALREAAALAEAADRVAALSLEAVAASGPAGSPSPYSEVVAEARGGAGQRASAAAIRAALAGGGVVAPGREVTVQDPLAFRTAPQLHGALREAVDRLRAELELELAARAENPVVDVRSGTMVSGGNFQALPLALAFEALRLALAHVASASERRSAALSLALAPARAAGRTTVPGLLLYAAASDAAELKQLAVPVTLGSTTLSGVEDHASLAAPAVRLAQRSLALARDVLAVEALHAVDLLGTAGVEAAGAGTGPLAAAIRVSANTRTPAARLVSEVGRLLG